MTSVLLMTSGCSLLSAANCSKPIASSQCPPSFKAPKAELMPITSPQSNFQKRCVALRQFSVDLITWLTDRLSGWRDEMGKAWKTPTARCQSLSPQRPRTFNVLTMVINACVPYKCRMVCIFWHEKSSNSKWIPLFDILAFHSSRVFLTPPQVGPGRGATKQYIIFSSV